VTSVTKGRSQKLSKKKQPFTILKISMRLQTIYQKECPTTFYAIYRNKLDVRGISLPSFYAHLSLENGLEVMTSTGMFVDVHVVN
jgi:hypothetical protein